MHLQFSSFISSVIGANNVGKWWRKVGTSRKLNWNIDEEKIDIGSESCANIGFERDAINFRYVNDKSIKTGDEF